MRRALDSYVIRGVQHNAPLLRSVLDVPAFVAGNISTAFLAEHYPTPEASSPERLPLTPRQEEQLLALAALLWVRKEQRLSGGDGLLKVGAQGIVAGSTHVRNMPYCAPCALLFGNSPMQCAEQSALAGRCLPLALCLQGDLPLVLTLGGQQVPLTVRPAEPRMVAHSASAGSRSNNGSARGQALEVQLPGRILYVQDAGGSTAQLVHAEVDGQAVHLQVLAAGPRHYHLQHCGAQRVVEVDSPAAAQLAQHMPPPVVEDFSKVGAWVGGWVHGCCRAGWHALVVATIWVSGRMGQLALWQLNGRRPPAWCALAFVSMVPPAAGWLQVVRSPMPGTLVSVSVELGQRVSHGDEVCCAVLPCALTWRCVPERTVEMGCHMQCGVTVLCCASATRLLQLPAHSTCPPCALPRWLLWRR
jgi:hypothetical protein